MNETNSEKYLSDVLKRGANNFDILRLLAALAVIVGHAYAIAPQPPLQDGVLSILHFDYSGSLAVKFFFFLSGLLVTNSIILKPNAFQFLAKRAFRIFPGLLICLLIAVFFVGPIFTKVSLTEYFSSTETWTYITKNFFLADLQWKLTGVFSDSKYGLNGSLWTLPYEVLCYIYLAILYGLGFLKNKIVANIFFIFVVVISFIVPQYLPTFFSQNPDSHLLPACFALGALFANNKDIIKINFYYFALLWIFSIILNHSVVYQFVFYLAFFYTTIYISSLSLVINRLKIPFDASYGVYVYGFMIQQCVFASLPSIGVHANQAITAAIAICLGTLSWFLIEKPFVDFGHRTLNNNTPKVVKENIFNFFKLKISNIKANENAISSNIYFFCFFIITAFIMHALVLKFIFPGYYSPLYPQHTDFYMPAAFANTPELTYIDLFSWPRPLNLIFGKFIGNFGIGGSIACIIALVCINIGLSALLIKRIFKIAFNWLLIVAFVGYCYLLFSHPYFYIFYAQDIGAQLSYFFLIAGAYSFYITYNKHFVISNIILFFCCLLAFLSKETYGLSALFFAFLWFIYCFKKDALWKALLPFFTVTASLFILLLINIHIKSTFVNLNAKAGAPYQINLNPFIVLSELFSYLTEALNIFTDSIIVLIAYLLIQYKKNNKKELLLVAIGCLVGMIVSILPNAILPNHHFKGYSFNGTYLLYLPLLFAPLFDKYLKKDKNILIAILILCLASPILNIGKYKGNDWVLIQEDTQRNLLKALKPLINNLEPSTTPKKILIEGISFPFHPFAFPQSLRVFPNAKYATFDVINSNPSYPNGKRIDLVKLIDATDTALTQYDQKWIFNQEGKLIVQTGSKKEEALINTELNNQIKINQENFSEFTSTGFYNRENDIRWTNGNASIKLNTTVTIDSLIIELDTYMPPNCKNISPAIVIVDTANTIYTPSFVVRKDDAFFYSFKINKKTALQKINISSQTVNQPSDPRVLSFPFISLEIKY